MKRNIFKMVAAIAVAVIFSVGCTYPDEDTGGSSGNGNGTSGNGNDGGSSSSAASSTQFGAPTGVTAVANNANSVTISWITVSGATSYRIYRSSSESGDYSQVGSVTGSLNTSFTNSVSYSYQPEWVAPNTIYYYRVTALNGSGESTRSSAVEVTTPAAN